MNCEHVVSADDVPILTLTLICTKKYGLVCEGNSYQKVWIENQSNVSSNGLDAMKITSMEEYGLRCLVRVAREGASQPVSAQDVADAEGMSLAYAQKVLRALSAGELVCATRGAQGGYTLTRDASLISLGDAIRALGGALEPDTICERHTGEHEVCSNVNQCSIRPVWSCLSTFIMRTFEAIPLALLMQREEVVEQMLMKLVPEPIPPAVPTCPLENHTHV